MNNKAIILAASVAALLFLSTASAVPTRALTFEDRLKAEDAIERAYYSHLVGPAPPIEEALPRGALEQKVRTYLKQTVALQSVWNSPITEAMLQKELERINTGTHFPERVEEIYKALNNDPLLILECFVRPILVNRLARSFFALDQRIHATARNEASELHQRLESGEIDISSAQSMRQVLDITRSEHGDAAEAQSLQIQGSQARISTRGREVELGTREFDAFLHRTPAITGKIGPMIEEWDRFVMRVPLEESQDKVREVICVVPKVGWDTWWAETADRFDESEVEPVIVHSSHVMDVVKKLRPIVSSCDPDDMWDNGSLDDLPMPRYGHTAVWTGSLMIVWGGLGESGYFQNNGGRYDPLTDTWTPTSTLDAPEARYLHAGVWDGSEMIVWGGNGVGGALLASGGRYNPLTDSWQPTSMIGAPAGRVAPTAVWTGNEVIIWGGSRGAPVNSGGRYYPATDTWSATSSIAVPTPRSRHTAIWTGNEMIVWGGTGSTGSALSTGARYSPGTNSWTATSSLDVPAPRARHSSVWTGREMIVWGGGPFDDDDRNSGGRYNPLSDTWAQTALANAPSARNSHTAVWTGHEMIIWGGKESSIDFEQSLNTGGRYDPDTDSWLQVATLNVPSARANHTAIWTGEQLMIWGGHSDVSQGQVQGFFNTGARYDVTSNSWTPIADYNAPSGARSAHTAVWTGNLMLVWGGDGDVPIPVNSGARYDPTTDSWSTMSLAHAPVARDSHQAIWTGKEMIVWGGLGVSGPLNDGGRYNPLTDEWLPISVAGAPSPRYLTTPAVWTGDEMIIWGGLTGTATTTNTGGRYDPISDSWTPTAIAGAPSPRHSHSLVWTGSEVIVWGGESPSVGKFNNGGRYDPTTDSWIPVPVAGSPSARSGHTAIWTGGLMIVWGPGSTGGRFDPLAGTWAPTSTMNAPVFTTSHSALWTGREMILWSDAGTGARYDPMQDTWTTMSSVNAPEFTAASPTSVWTGSFMIVWGRNWGGRYSFGQSVDDDGDTRSECAGDCNDLDPSVWAAPMEVAKVMVYGGACTTLTWEDQRPVVGPGVLYEVVSGALLTPGSVNFTSSSTLQVGVPNLYTDNRPPPVRGEGFWYLLRARNSCGLGTFGTALRDSDIPTSP